MNNLNGGCRTGAVRRCGRTSANSGVPGASPNGTTPGALGNSTQSLAPNTSGAGSGLSGLPTESDSGVTPGGPGSQSFNPSADAGAGASTDIGASTGSGD